MSQKGLSHIDNAARNKNIILNIVRERAPLSRKDICDVLNLSIATTKRFIEELISEKLIIETGFYDTARGRKAALLRLNQDYCYSIGSNILPHVIDIVGLNFIGDIVLEKKVENIKPDKEIILPKLIEEVRDAIDNLNHSSRGRCLGIGIGIAGLVNTAEGTVLYCPSISGWENVAFADILRNQFDTQIIIDDSVRCMALLEKRVGAAKELHNFLYIYIGDGVGSGLFLDGKMYRGRHGVAGEFGHINIKQNGTLCNCGNMGCLEAFVSINALLQEVNRNIASNVYSSLNALLNKNSTISLTDIYDEAMKGDKLANIIINSTSENIGIGLANLVNIFDPGVIILGGEVINAFQDFLLEGIIRNVLLKSINEISSRTKIIKSQIKEYSAAMGAATLPIEKFLKNDIINI